MCFSNLPRRKNLKQKKVRGVGVFVDFLHGLVASFVARPCLLGYFCLHFQIPKANAVRGRHWQSAGVEIRQKCKYGKISKVAFFSGAACLLFIRNSGARVVKWQKWEEKNAKKNARVANFLRRFTRRVFFCFKEGFEGVWFFFACWICGFGACAAKKTPFSSGFFGTFCRQLALRKV